MPTAKNPTNTPRGVQAFLTDEALRLIVMVHTGEVYDLTDAELTTWKVEMSLLVDGIKNTTSKFDEGLRDRRDTYGDDYRKGFDFRAPVKREIKAKPASEIKLEDIFSSKK